MNHGILYSKSKSFTLSSYSDSDYAGDLETRRSTSGNLFFLANGPISWLSQRQPSVSLSTTEAEYISPCTAAREVTWLRRLLSDTGYPCDMGTKLYIDNQSTIKLIKNPEFHKKTKHIDVQYHFIREKYERGELDVEFMPSDKQLSDILTKALCRPTFELLRGHIVCKRLKEQT